MIPSHLSLVPLNKLQLAAIQAISVIEDKQTRGKRLGRFPYAREMYRQLNGNSKITALDIICIDASYNPKDRQGSTKERYLEALDTLISSRGEKCYLPLSSSVLAQLFPEMQYRNQERRYRQWDKQAHQKNRQEKLKQQRKKRRYQCQLAQAEIELAFVTPSQLNSWYSLWSKQSVCDDDLIEMVQKWSKRFIALRSDAFITDQPLWSVMLTMQEELGSRSGTEQWLDGLFLPNKISVGD